MWDSGMREMHRSNGPYWVVVLDMYKGKGFTAMRGFSSALYLDSKGSVKQKDQAKAR